MGKDFDKFVNQLPLKARDIHQPNANTTNDVTTNTGSITGPKKPDSNIAPLYCTREKISLKTFIEIKEKELFNPKMSK